MNAIQTLLPSPPENGEPLELPQKVVFDLVQLIARVLGEDDAE